MKVDLLFYSRLKKERRSFERTEKTPLNNRYNLPCFADEEKVKNFPLTFSSGRERTIFSLSPLRLERPF